MGPAKVIRRKCCWITNVGQREVLLQCRRDRANSIAWNLIVRELGSGLRVEDWGEPRKVAVPHGLRRNGSKIERTQWNQLLVPGDVKKGVVLPDRTSQFGLPIMLNVASSFGLRMRDGIQAGIEMLIVDHAVELVLATLGSQVIGDHARAVRRRVDCGHRSLLKELAGIALFARTIVADAVRLERLLRGVLT